MSTRAFQSAVARLVIDPDYREAVGREAASGDSLSAVERTRLRALARDAGLAITRKLHQGFRLNKIVGRVPLCRALLGEQGMADALQAFWVSHLPTSFYYLHEATAFCDYLVGRAQTDLRVPFLDEVVAFELAQLRLQSLPNPGKGQFEAVAFRHDPMHLLGELRDGVVPATVRGHDVMLIGTINAQRCVQWHTMHMAAWHAWQARSLPGTDCAAAG